MDFILKFMPVYPVRLDDELYRKLRERAQGEGCPVATLLRESASAAAGNPSIDDQLFSIREELAKLSCSIDNNRLLLTILAANVMEGDVDRQKLEKLLADYDTEMSNRRLRQIRFDDKLRKIARDFPNEGGGQSR